MILVGSTIPAYKAADHPAESLSWLQNARAMKEICKYRDIEIEFFASLEYDGRGEAPFYNLLGKLDWLSAMYWWFSLDMNDDEITSGTRLARICAGRNLIQDYALSQVDCSHILFLDSDLEVPADSLVRLLDIRHPIVGGHVPAYCLKGPHIDYNNITETAEYNHNIQEHWNTAGFLLVEREVFRHIRWGIDPDAGRTDDPQYQHMAKLLGFGETWVDHAVVGKHRPQTNGVLPPMEHRGHDRKYYR